MYEDQMREKNSPNLRTSVIAVQFIINFMQQDVSYCIYCCCKTGIFCRGKQGLDAFTQSAMVFQKSRINLEFFVKSAVWFM